MIATGVQLGPRALGLAAQLNKQHGLTMRKTCAILREMFQLRLSPGGLSQALARMTDKLEPAYENLLAQLRAGPCVHSEETSWWVKVIPARGWNQCGGCSRRPRS